MVNGRFVNYFQGMASEVSLGKGENKPLLHAMPGQSHIEVKVRSEGPRDRVSGKILYLKTVFKKCLIVV